MKALLDKLKSDTGDSLPEALAAALIISLSLVAVLSVSQVAYKSMAQAKSRYTEYYSLLNAREAAEPKYNVEDNAATVISDYLNERTSVYDYFTGNIDIYNVTDGNKKVSTDTASFYSVYGSDDKLKFTYIYSRWWE
ncbi:MAG: hypothetical protein LKG26_01560 [Saccharofermentans sp.]|nr:hypothetical protein [Mageeibacillus sp.]MCI1263770.1 hypothetical protein [Saccharofermentans sp.]MCI1274764.1 hypothetical protein [Saccharofermentans sp.]MCI1769194.1 hypothetical protein [Mageeibacillus sp.]MCI2044733.1 hypothetical protein [Mageeibacillus sp.]